MTRTITALLAAACLAAMACAPVRAQTYMPTKGGSFHMPDEWLFSSGQPYHFRAPSSASGRGLARRAPSPDEQAAIDDIRRQFASLEAKVLLLGQGDRILDMAFKPPATEGSLLLSASVDKTVTALSAGVAICDGKIALATRVREVLPELAGTDIGESTLRDNLMMASGAITAFDDSQSFTAEETADLQAGRRSFMDFLRGRLGKARWFTRPGERFDYKSQDPLLVGMMVSAAYGQQGRSFRQWQAEHFFPRVGVADRRIQGTDRHGYAQSDGNTRMTIGDWARLAMFVAESRRAPGCLGDFVRDATSTRIRNDRRFGKMYGGYGYFIWTDNEQLPDSYSALGYGGQAIVWSTVDDRFMIVFGNATANIDIHRMARRWFEVR